MQKLLLLLMALVVSHGALAQAGEGSGGRSVPSRRDT